MRLRQFLGIRARLVVLALILVAPLMLERARSLEDARARQITAASTEFASLARHSADAQREVISSVETMLKSAAYIRASIGGIGRSCDIMRASLPGNLPWIRSLTIVGHDGRVQCSTNNAMVGTNLGDRDYFKRAQTTRAIVFSDFLIARASGAPVVVAAYPVSAINDQADSVIIAGVSLDWMSKIMNNLGGRPGIMAALIDSRGVVLAAPADKSGTIGRPLNMGPLPSAIEKAIGAGQPQESLSFVAADGSRHTVSFAPIADTRAQLVVSIDEAKVSADIEREIRNAYLQLGLVCLLVLLGALVAAQKLIIQPIEIMAGMAKRFGHGDWTARAAQDGLPAEFVPLAHAFDTMAGQLAERERELLAINDRLTVMASSDILSGLANRRGIQSRLDFEWMKAQQNPCELSLLMIDVDHFKLFNDTYGHPEGDACLARIGETLDGIAAATLGFAGRYGGEEFCLLLPATGVARAMEIGEMVRAAVQDLAIPHTSSGHQTVTVSVGVATTRPSSEQRPGDLIEAADAALYAAKRRGRNAVVEHGLVRATDGVIALAS